MSENSPLARELCDGPTCNEVESSASQWVGELPQNHTDLLEKNGCSELKIVFRQTLCFCCLCWWKFDRGLGGCSNKIMTDRAVVLSRHQSDCDLLQRQDKMSDSERTCTRRDVSVNEEVINLYHAIWFSPLSNILQWSSTINCGTIEQFHTSMKGITSPRICVFLFVLCSKNQLIYPK